MAPARDPDEAPGAREQRVVAATRPEVVRVPVAAAVLSQGAPGGGIGGPPIFGGAPTQKSPTPPIVLTPGGGGQAALQRAARMPSIARSGAIPPLTVAVGACNSLGGQCVINPANPSVAMQIAPPAGDLFYVVPVLTYSSSNTALSNELGTGWMHTFKRQISVSGTNVTVTMGTGQAFAYSGVRGGLGFVSPNGSPAVNSLQSTAGFSVFTETQPDGTIYKYLPTTGGLASLSYLQNPGGARWTVTYDGSGRVSFVTDPLVRRTTFSYDPTSGNITSILDPFGWRTTLTVDGSNNLAQVISPELCITSLSYAGSHSLRTWTNPLGDVTTFVASGQQLAVTSPLGAVTTLINNQAGGPHPPPGPGDISTTCINPLGQITSLTCNAGGALINAINPIGIDLTYTWDSNLRLETIGDGLGNNTTFGYLTNATNKIAYLTSITQPSGGIFTYSYNSAGQVTAITDQLGETTTLTWNASGLRSAAINALGNATSYTYNSMGQLVSVQNPLGQLVTLVYNSLGQQIALVNSLGNAVSYTEAATLYGYSSNSPINFSDPSGLDWSWGNCPLPDEQRCRRLCLLKYPPSSGVETHPDCDAFTIRFRLCNYTHVFCRCNPEAKKEKKWVGSCKARGVCPAGCGIFTGEGDTQAECERNAFQACADAHCNTPGGSPFNCQCGHCYCIRR